MLGRGTGKVSVWAELAAGAGRIGTAAEAAFLAAPVAVMVLGFAIGIVIDRWYAPGSGRFWLLGTVALALVSLCLPDRTSRLGLGCLVLSCVLLGGWRHHVAWHDVPADGVSRVEFAAEEPARVEGIVQEVPRVRSAPGYRGETRTWTQLILRVLRIDDGGGWITRSGRLAVSLDGDWSHIRPGSRVCVTGDVERIVDAANPCAERWSDWWRAQGIRQRMRAETVEYLGPSGGVVEAIMGFFGSTRSATRLRLTEMLQGESGELGAALLLGERDGVDQSVSDAFMRTGTMHVLAISGMHLHVFALGLWCVGPVLGLRRKQTVAGIMLATAAYAFLVGGSPSITRAAVMTCVAGLLELLDRRAGAANSLGLAGLAILAWNPSDLFSAGAQLSFLGVAGLIWVVPGAVDWICRTDDENVSALDRLEWRLQTGPARWLRRIKLSVLGGVMGSVMMWCLTTPIVAHRFHVVPWVAMVLNLPLIFLTSVAMWAGGLALLLDFVWRPLGVPASWLGARALELCEILVRWGVEPEIGHQYVPGVAGWQMLIGSACMLGVWVYTFRRRPVTTGKLAASVLVSLVVIICQYGFFPRKPAVFEVDVLNVAHGLAVVMQSEDGTTWVYDCGKMNQPMVGRGDIASALWSRGRRRVDCLVLSHADTDHFNGAFDLIERFAVGCVRIPLGFETAENPEAARLMRECRRRGISVEAVEIGQTWRLGNSARITSLAPSRGLPDDVSDNARSLVLEVEVQGRRLILTGDLEDEGLVRLARDWSELATVDVWLAPHHGGAGSNPAWLYLWISPRLVISSQDKPRGTHGDHLEQVTGEHTAIWRTCQEGAIRLRWDQAGRIIATGMGSGRYWELPADHGAAGRAAAAVPGE